MNRALASIAVAVLVGACSTAPGPKQPLATTPAGDPGGGAVTRRVLPEQPAANSPATPVARPPFVVPPDTQYVCVTDVAGETRQVAIQFDPKVRELCRKHPEMGPCQYERNACRKSGGRVYASTGEEITMVTEADYDKKVMRVRFRAN